MTEKEKTKAKKEKKPVGETMRTSLTLFNEGMSIKEIAKSRNLGVSTIGTHLAKYVADGTLNINRFISDEQRKKALNLLEESAEIGSVFQLLGKIMKQEEISIFMAWLRAGRP